jgi:hypothetical protein
MVTAAEGGYEQDADGDRTADRENGEPAPSEAV